MSLRSRLKLFFRGGKEQVESSAIEASDDMAIVEFPDGSTRLLPKEEAEKVS